uniref:Uncharacterized protein n=1 Tax=Ignisphaera aggregans TaxID=334771 RepID=A0A7C2VNJ3_9CREN
MLLERINISIDLGFTIFRLGKENPCIALISGITYDDGCGVATLRNVVDKLKSLTLRGSVIVVPHVNELDLDVENNRYSGSLFNLLIKRFSEVLPSNCLVIELRCASGFEPHIVIDKASTDNSVKNVLEAIPIKYIVMSNTSNTAKILRERGFNVITIVFGGGKEFSLDDVEQYVQVILDFLGNLNIIKRRVKQVQHEYLDRYHVIKCHSRGIFVPSIARGSEVSAKDLIGSLDGAEVTSPVDGVVLYVSSPRLCNIGDVICVIGAKSKGTP